MDQLCRYDWPGNVRELEHTLQTMVAMNTGPWFSVADLPSIFGNKKKERDSLATEALTVDDLGDQIVPLGDLEKSAILRALRVTKGDRTLAASSLGIGRTTLYRKLKEYGM
jgi:DNA-binding NtrC family response regulator